MLHDFRKMLKHVRLPYDYEQGCRGAKAQRLYFYLKPETTLSLFSARIKTTLCSGFPEQF